uniref:Leucine-rich repeat-containing N-terminal plant-type domain-containing protein n=1 Tax=Pseudo-nitzschia australis TaxID=44445 RepID=A0A7S4AML5_9STRA
MKFTNYLLSLLFIGTASTTFAANTSPFTSLQGSIESSSSNNNDNDNDNDNNCNGRSSHLLLQRLALLTLYYQTGGDYSWTTSSTRTTGSTRTSSSSNNKKRNDNECWITEGIDECFWDGVVCDDQHRVVELTLVDRNLLGVIPFEIWVWLPHLEVLNLSDNRLQGGLPHDVLWPTATVAIASTNNGHNDTTDMYTTTTYLPVLTRLDLSKNDLEGRGLPLNISHGLPSLRVLNLAENFLTGVLPLSLPSFASSSTGSSERTGTVLEQLYLGSNRFEGTLPFEEWFSDNSNDFYDNNENSNTNGSLRILDLSNNLLAGTIPVAIAQNPLFESLSLHSNRLLHGTIPVVAMAGGTYSGNANTGSDTSPNLVFGNTNLKELELSNCNLHGNATELLQQLLTLPRLERLVVTSNRLTGSLPSSTSIMPFGSGESASASAPVLEALSLGNNELTGTIPPELVGSWLTNLQYLQLFGNDLEGTIPRESFQPQQEQELETATTANNNNNYRQSQISVLWIHDNPKLVGTMPCPRDAADDASSAFYDFTADCAPFLADVSTSSSTSTSTSSTRRVDCPCCTRCY